MSLDEEYFSWDNWDTVDTMDFQFSSCVLKKPIGKYPVGTKFDYIFVEYSKGIISLEEEKFNIKYIIE